MRKNWLDMKESPVTGCRRTGLIAAVLCFFLILWASVGARAQGAVHWQTAMNDTLLLHLNVSYTAAPRRLQVDAAYVVRRGQLKRTSVETRKLKTKFTDEAAPAFTLSLEFSYKGIRYQVRGRYADQEESLLRCVPLRLSKETMREGEYM